MIKLKSTARRLILATGLMMSLTVSVEASASSAELGLVSGIYGINNGVIMFMFDGARSATPACHTQGTRWAINAATPAGQAQLSLLLSAWAQRKRIYIRGTGNCSVWGDTETVDWFQVE